MLRVRCVAHTCLLLTAGEGGMCLRGSSMTLPVGLEQWPPTVTAAAWKALEDRSALEARGRSVPSEVSVKVGPCVVDMLVAFCAVWIKNA